MVYIGETVDETTGEVTGGTASPTQWYCVRMAAMRVLHDCCNGAANFNGIQCNSYSVSATAGATVNQTVVLPLDDTYEIGKMYLSSGDDTLGLTVVQSGATISITGTPTGAGTFTLRIYVDQWIPIDIVETGFCCRI